MNITRRLFLRNTAAAGAVAGTVAAPAAIEAAQVKADLTAIPTDVVEKIKTWQDAHRAMVATNEAYCTSLHVKPIDKAECDRNWKARAEAVAAVGPAREAMIFALWSV